jgi:hypothetical protein
MTKIHLLIIMCVAYVVLSIYLRKKERELGYSPRSKTRKIIWAGITWIQVPLIPLMVGPLFVQQEILSNENPVISGLCLLIGFVIAWVWWSVNVSLWRRWAERRGVDADELQYEGESSSILWPKGHFFERTEYDRIIHGQTKYPNK